MMTVNFNVGNPIKFFDSNDNEYVYGTITRIEGDKLWSLWGREEGEGYIYKEEALESSLEEYEEAMSLQSVDGTKKAIA